MKAEAAGRRLISRRDAGVPMFVAYVTCGDGDTVRIVEELEQAGADMIELGIPFSDPIADGPVIQAASQRALRNGTKTRDVFDIAKKIRERSAIPLIAFSYLNPVMRYGVENFAHDAADAGINSLLLTDLPPESAGEIRHGDAREEHRHDLPPCADVDRCAHQGRRSRE